MPLSGRRSRALPNQSGIARSTDNGNTWQVVPSIITNAGEAIVSDNAIIVAEDNFIWRSTDDGMSWDVVEQFALTGIGSFAKAGTKLFGAARTGIQTSTDNGASWNFEPFSNGAFSFSSNGSTIYLGSNSKVFKSTDVGATWIDVSTGLGKGGIQALFFDGTLFSPGHQPMQQEYTEARTAERAGTQLPRDCRSVKLFAA